MGLPACSNVGFGWKADIRVGPEEVAFPADSFRKRFPKQTAESRPRGALDDVWVRPADGLMPGTKLLIRL